MVFVPWRDLDICPFWALHKTECNLGDKCRWKHPPADEVKQLWDLYTVAESQGITVDMLSYLGVRAPPPSNHPVAETDEASSSLPFGPTRVPPPPRHPPQHTPRGFPLRPLHVRTGASGLKTRRISNAVPSLPELHTRRTYSLVPERADYMSSRSCEDDSEDHRDWSREALWQHHRNMFPPPGSHNYDMPPPPLPLPRPPRRVQNGQHAEPCHERLATDDRGIIPREPEFDPRRSSNAFVNGSEVYRFVWGDPLCVRCGAKGHLPKQCKNTELSMNEQDYLYKLMRIEQNRSKMERGIMFYEPISTLAPSQQPVRSPPKRSEGSLLDAPPSPQASRHDGPESQSDYWEGCKEQQLQKRRALLQEEDKMVSVNSYEAQNPEFTLSNSVKKKVRRRSTAQSSATTPAVVAAVGRAEKEQDHEEVGRHLQDAAWKRQRRSGDRRDTTETATALNFHFGICVPPTTVLSTDTTDATASVPFSRAGTSDMPAVKRLSNGEAKPIGPHPSTIRVSAPYITQSAIEKRLQPTALDAQERSLAEAREDSVRLQGLTWLDTVRRALQLPIRTFTTACVYYHKFRLAHPTVEYSWSDAAAASLLTSCKNEDTLKKSRDILAAAYNLKQPASHEQVGADDAIFDQPSRVVIGLERLVLESGGFDFRSRWPHQTLVKISKSLPKSEDLKSVSQLAWTILTDLHRTFAPLKQTSSTLALASLELAAHFKATTSENNTCTVRDDLQALDRNKWYTTREEVMETLLDALDLYTHHTGSTILGTKYSLDNFLRIRLALNKECSDASLPRYTVVQPPPSPDDATGTVGMLRVSNGHPTPVSPPQPGTQVSAQSNGAWHNQPPPEGGGTLRFLLNPQRATAERAEVNRFHTEEWEEYEEEIEVPLPRTRSRDKDRDRNRDYAADRSERDRYRDVDRRSTREDRDPIRGPPADRNRERESLREREREAERERTRLRDRERETRYDDRRYGERERDRRTDDRRERDRERRYYDDDRRRGRDTR